jgi:hypothetical protein
MYVLFFPQTFSYRTHDSKEDLNQFYVVAVYVIVSIHVYGEESVNGVSLWVPESLTQTQKLGGFAAAGVTWEKQMGRCCSPAYPPLQHGDDRCVASRRIEIHVSSLRRWLERITVIEKVRHYVHEHSTSWLRLYYLSIAHTVTFFK